MPRTKSKPRPRTGPRTEAAILLRMSREESEEIRAAARRDDHPVTVWLRLVALRAARVSPPV